MDDVKHYTIETPSGKRLYASYHPGFNSLRVRIPPRRYVTLNPEQWLILSAAMPEVEDLLKEICPKIMRNY